MRAQELDEVRFQSPAALVRRTERRNDLLRTDVGDIRAKSVKFSRYRWVRAVNVLACKISQAKMGRLILATPVTGLGVVGGSGLGLRRRPIVVVIVVPPVAGTTTSRYAHHQRPVEAPVKDSVLARGRRPKVRLATTQPTHAQREAADAPREGRHH